MTARIAFLCSAGGGNLKLLHQLCENGAVAAEITHVIADRDCPALAWAHEQGIAAEVVYYSRQQPYELTRLLALATPDIVVTTIHKILHAELVAQYAGRMVNLHYSLLPAFSGLVGMEPVRRARSLGCRLIGATAHIVDQDVDAGRVLAQACLADDGAPSEARLFDAVFRCGGVALATAVTGLIDGRAGQAGGLLRAGNLQLVAAPLPNEATSIAFADPAFWAALQ